jgi:hypothetical protein
MTKRSVFLIAALASIGAAMPHNPQDVSKEERDLVTGFFRKFLVLPDNAVWRFESVRPFLNGDVVCGHVNYQNSDRRYLGFVGFYAEIRHGEVRESGMEPQLKAEDPAGAIEFAYQIHCPTS